MPTAVTILLTLATSIGESGVAGLSSSSVPEALAMTIAPSRRTVIEATVLARASASNSALVAGIAGSSTAFVAGNGDGGVVAGVGCVVLVVGAAAVVVGVPLVVAVGIGAGVLVVVSDVLDVVVEPGNEVRGDVVGVGMSAGVVDIVGCEPLSRLFGCSLSAAHDALKIIRHSARAIRWARVKRPIRTTTS